MPLGDLGTYTASVVPNAFVFDHYTHLRADLCAPRGPRPHPPASDELRLGPTIDWIVEAAPQQNRDLLSTLDGACAIDVTGPGARTFTIGDGVVSARVTCRGHDLVLWSTQRAAWDQLAVAASGDPAILTGAQQIHVF